MKKPRLSATGVAGGRGQSSGVLSGGGAGAGAHPAVITVQGLVRRHGLAGRDGSVRAADLALSFALTGIDVHLDLL
jgi:hypothetical protein